MHKLFERDYVHCSASLRLRYLVLFPKVPFHSNRYSETTKIHTDLVQIPHHSLPNPTLLRFEGKDLYGTHWQFAILIWNMNGDLSTRNPSNIVAGFYHANAISPVHLLFTRYPLTLICHYNNHLFSPLPKFCLDLFSFFP